MFKIVITYSFQTAENYGWTSGYSILSEFGTMHMEFAYLSDITGEPIFKTLVERIRTVIQEKSQPGSLYPNFLHPIIGSWGQNHHSLGAFGDSFYEYLLKHYILFPEDSDFFDMFQNLGKGILSKSFCLA